MSSSRMEQVFYNTHSRVSHYVLRHTSHRQRSVVEHAVLGLAVCGFCVVILSHRTFVHREDIAGIMSSSTSSCEEVANADDTTTGGGESSSYGLPSGMGFVIGEGQGGVSVYSIAVQLIRSGYAWLMTMASSSSSKRQPPLQMTNSKNGTSSSWSSGKKIPALCLQRIPGYREDADVNHILLHYDDTNGDGEEYGSRAFTVYRGSHEREQIMYGGAPTIDNNKRQQSNSCIVGGVPPEESVERGTSWFGLAKKDRTRQHYRGGCSRENEYLLARHGYHASIRSSDEATMGFRQQNQKMPTATARQRRYSPIVYSYSHSHGLLRLPPALKHAHNISTQFVVASSSDPHCFGEPFAQSIIFRLVGPDTVLLNWIVGGLSQRHALAATRPRFVYHWKTRKELDLDAYHMDHYAFSSKSSSGGGGAGPSGGAYGSMQSTTGTVVSSGLPFPPTTTMSNIVATVRTYPLYRFLSFLTFKLTVLLSTLLIFFLTTSLVSFTFQETQDRMLEFTLQLQTRVRARMPLGRLILGHVLENLVFVPIMVGMIFFLIEFYGGDKFLAFMVLSMVWVCEVFSAVSIRSAQGMHFFPRVFFLYFTLFHVYFFSCPIGFTYASLASTILFLFHTMLFFCNRYEFPALHAGLITPHSPRMERLVASPPRIHPSSLSLPHNVQLHQPPPIPRIYGLDERSSHTLPTAPMSSTIDFTPQSDQSTLLPPSYPGAMRSYVVAASTSLQSIRSIASIQSLASIAAERTTSPNVIFQGGYGFNDSGEVEDESEEDSYMARVSGQSR